MKTIVKLCDPLEKCASELADSKMDKSDPSQEPLQTQRRAQAAQRLALLGSMSPSMEEVPRRKSDLR